MASRTFTDALKREWTVRIDGPIVHRVRAETCDLDRCRHRKPSACSGFDLADLDGAQLSALYTDPVLLIDVLWLVLRDEATKKGLTQEQFCESLRGDALEAAYSATLEAVADFFQSRKAKMILALAAKDRELEDLAISQAMERVQDPATQQKLREAIEQRVDQDMKKLLTRLNSATDSPEQSESAPTD